MREVEILHSCSSPYILKVLDQDLEWKERVPGAPASAYYVSEKWKGSLEQRQRDLGDARSRIVLFRPKGNFLVAQELNNVVLADFGTARALSGSSLTQAFEVVGTPYYRAPEVNNGSSGSVQSEVYCMGRVLEWLLTGDVSKDMGTRPVPRG